MRAGSGTVLLVGFALVVMLLSTAGIMTPPSIGMKQDPSQDFADFASSINTAVSSYNYLRGKPEEKLRYLAYTLHSVVDQYRIKGIDGVVFIAAVVDNSPYYCCDIKKEGVSCYYLESNNYKYDYDEVIAIYYLTSRDGSSNFTGYASNSAVYNPNKDSLVSLSQLRIIPPVLIPPALCFHDVGQGASSEHFLIVNLNKIRINIILKYVGDDYVKELSVSFPGQGVGTVRDDDHDGDLEFYLDPMTEPKGKGVALGQRTIGDAHITIVHNTAGQSSKLVVIVPEYNLERDIPIYWNTCPVIPWGRVISSLRG